MSAVEILSGAVEPIGIRLRQGASVITGATVRARVLRTSDGKELDWSTNTFVTQGSAVTPRLVLTENPANSGLYSTAWNTSSITNPAALDSYEIEFDQTAPTVRTFLRQCEVRVRSSTLLARPGDQMALVSNAITAAKIAPAAISASAFATDAIDANAIAASGATEIGVAARDATLNATSSSFITAGSVGLKISQGDAATLLGTAVPGAFSAGSVGARLDANVSSRSAPGDQMTLGAGSIVAATFASNAITSAAIAPNAITSSTLATDAIGASQLASSAVSEIQSGLATSVAVAALPTAAQNAAAAWDELTAAHAVNGSYGLLIKTFLDATVSSRSTLTATQVWQQSVPGGFTTGQAGFVVGYMLDDTITSRLAAIDYSAPPAANAIAMEVDTVLTASHGAGNWIGLTALQTENSIWDAVTSGHGVVGSYGLLVRSNLDVPVSGRASTTDVTAARDAIRGADSLDLTLIGGAGFNTAVDSLVAATAAREAFAALLGDLQNNTTFSAAIPLFVRPTTGSTSYVIRVAIDATDGTPDDPDANTITVAVVNVSNTSRDGNLSSTTMTRLGVGRYEVSYTVDATDDIEQLIFTFSYEEGSVAFARDRVASVVADAATGFTTADRATLGDILTDTSTIEPLVSVNLDAKVTSLQGSGYVEATDSLHAISQAILSFGSLSTIVAQIWGYSDRTLTGLGTSGLASSSELTARFDEIKGSPWVSGTDNLHAIYGQAHGGMLATAAFQASALAAIAAVPDDVWDVDITLHQSQDTTGQALFQASNAPSPARVADEVWTTAQGGAAGTMGFAVSLMRKWITNRCEETAGNPGSLILYDDSATTPLLTWQLRDGTGSSVLAAAGQPARRSAAE